MHVQLLKNEQHRGEQICVVNTGFVFKEKISLMTHRVTRWHYLVQIFVSLCLDAESLCMMH